MFYAKIYNYTLSIFSIFSEQISTIFYRCLLFQTLGSKRMFVLHFMFLKMELRQNATNKNIKKTA